MGRGGVIVILDFIRSKDMSERKILQIQHSTKQLNIPKPDALDTRVTQHELHMIVSLTNSILVDLSSFSDAEIPPFNRTCISSAGIVWIDLDSPLFPWGVSLELLIQFN